MKEIILCDKCEGLGKTYERVTSDESEYIKCTQCEGSGRLIKITTIEYKKLG